MYIHPIRTRVFKESESLAGFIIEHVSALPEKSILAVTSKIVSLSEGRAVPLASKQERVEWIKKEADVAVKTPHTWMTLRQGLAISNAGVDESNGNGKLILLPQDCYASAARLHTDLKRHFGTGQFGVIITDSRTLPLRRGSIGVCMGYAGLKPLKDYTTSPDIFGKPWNLGIANAVDALAAASVHVMGETNQLQPLALITDSVADFTDAAAAPADMNVDPKDDFYGDLYLKLRG